MASITPTRFMLGDQSFPRMPRHILPSLVMFGCQIGVKNRALGGLNG